MSEDKKSQEEITVDPWMRKYGPQLVDYLGKIRRYVWPRVFVTRQ